MRANSENFVHKVANQAGIPLGSTLGLGHLKTPGSLTDYAQNARANFETITKIGMHAAATMEPPKTQLGFTPSPGLSFVGQLAGTIAVAGIAAVAPAAVAPAAAAVVGAVMAGSDVKNFSTGHAAINGTQGGELTLAASAAQFNKDGEMTSYRAACDDTTYYDVQTGKVVPPSSTAPAAPPLKGAHNLKGIVGQVAEGYDADQIGADVRHMLDKERGNYLFARNKLDMLFGDSDAAGSLGVDMDMPAAVETPRPKPLNVGMGAKMGAPAFGLG